MKGWARRIVAAVWVGGLLLLGLAGWLGSPVASERFTAKTIVIRPEGPDGLRVTEYVDMDTGSTRRRGFFRELPVTLGVPTNITATSPNAPADLSVEPSADAVLIRVGDPDVTIRGRFRYVLDYVLPRAGLSQGRLALDVVGVNDTMPTEVITVYVTGLTLSAPVCSTGGTGSVGGCSLVPDDAGFVAATSLDGGEGLFVGGDVVGLTPPAAVPQPPLPKPRDDPATWPRAVVLALGASGVLLLTWWRSRRRGMNEVAGTSASDAAFTSGQGRRLVTDAELERLATLEVAPPGGLTPWEGALLLHEAVTDRTVEAWWGHAAALGRIQLSEEGNTLVISNIPGSPRLSDSEEVALAELFADGSGRYEVEGYDPRFASVWSKVAEHQKVTVDGRGWWKRPVHISQAGQASALVGAGILTALALGTFAVGGWINRLEPVAAFRWLGSLPAALVVVVAVSCLIGWLASASLRAARTAQGSALAVRTLSFRRFLAESEGNHVEEAWKRGVLREYTAWAVALDAADTWRRAAHAARVPAEAMTALTASTLLMDHRTDIARARSEPSSGSSSGGGGGVGSVGSGGGGGRSGSW